MLLIPGQTVQAGEVQAVIVLATELLVQTVLRKQPLLLAKQPTQSLLVLAAQAVFTLVGRLTQEQDQLLRELGLLQ